MRFLDKLFPAFGFKKVCSDCGREATHKDVNTGALRCIRCAYNSELFQYKTEGLLAPDKAAPLLSEYERLREELK